MEGEEINGLDPTVCGRAGECGVVAKELRGGCKLILYMGELDRGGSLEDIMVDTLLRSN